MSMVEIPLEDAQAFGVTTAPVRDFAAEVAAHACLRRAAALAGLGLELWG